MSITAVITSRNNEQTIERCLKSAWLYCDKIIVHDVGSDDRTRDVVREWARYHTEPLIRKKNKPQVINPDSFYNLQPIKTEVWVEDEDRYASWRLARSRRTVVLTDEEPVEPPGTMVVHLAGDSYLSTDPLRTPNVVTRPLPVTR